MKRITPLAPRANRRASLPYYVVLNSTEKPASSIVTTVETLAAARKWAKTDGKKIMRPGDRLDLCRVVDTLTAVLGDIVLVSDGPATEDDEKAPAEPAAPVATA